MNIRHVISGLLSRAPMTGYEIKKIMEASRIFHWSGNNSQIYRTLSDLQREDLVTGEVLHDAAAPRKKRYTLTEKGRRALSDLSRAFPEIPEPRWPFLTQISFAEGLPRQEMERLLDRYEREVKGVILAGREPVLPGESTPFFDRMQSLTEARLRQFYEAELAWVDRVRREVLPLVPDREEQKAEGEENTMEFKRIVKNDQGYVRVTAGQITSEQDGICLITACAEHGTNLALLPEDCLSADFLRLSSRLMGLVLQKLATYNIKAAAVLERKGLSPRMQEFLFETNRGQTFRFYETDEEAENWLTERSM